MIKQAIIGKLLLGALTASIIVVGSLPAQAGEVGKRVENQQDRIAAGVKDGQMTFGEYKQTETDLDRINAQRKADLQANGGKLTSAERSQLNHELNNNSERIYFDKHNRRKQK
jgi:multidrug resistance efflux pump